MGLRVEANDDVVEKHSHVLEEALRKAKRLFEYTEYGLVILDCLYRKSGAQGLRALKETNELRLFIEQLQSIKCLTQAASQTSCFLSQESSVHRINDLHTLVSRQMGLLLVRPIIIRSRGYYHPSPSACQLSFRYGNDSYIFRGEDFENLTDKMIRLDLNLIPRDVTLKIQQGYFKTAVFPLESFRVTSRTHRSACPKTEPDKYLSELELKFAIDCQGNASEIVIKLEVRWLYLRRPLFLGDLDRLENLAPETNEVQPGKRSFTCTPES